MCMGPVCGQQSLQQHAGQQLALGCRHVIIETNKTTARIFPQVPDCENALFWERMERLVELNQQLVDIGASASPSWQKNLRR